MTEPYSLDSAIESFFKSYTTVKREQCDEFALLRADGPIHPVEIQGAFSYTLTAGTDQSKIFQFRVHDSSIDLSLMDLAKRVHPQVVANCIYSGTIGLSMPLHIYEMDILPGTTYIMARDTSVPQPQDAARRQCSTMQDFARYIYISPSQA
jgi:hypothetical protein